MVGIKCEFKIWGLTVAQREAIIAALIDIKNQVDLIPDVEWETKYLVKFDETTETRKIEQNTEEVT